MCAPSQYVNYDLAARIPACFQLDNNLETYLQWEDGPYLSSNTLVTVRSAALLKAWSIPDVALNQLSSAFASKYTITPQMVLTLGV